jgi:hypothetical protein
MFRPEVATQKVREEKREATLCGSLPPAYDARYLLSERDQLTRITCAVIRQSYKLFSGAPMGRS